MRTLIASLLAITLLIPVAAFGEFYRYKDENGTMRFTDNLLEVPVDQRPKIYKESKSEKPANTGRKVEYKERDELSLIDAEKVKRLEQRKAEIENDLRRMEAVENGLRDAVRDTETEKQADKIMSEINARQHEYGFKYDELQEVNEKIKSIMVK